MSSHRNRREEVSFPSFLSWSPSIAHTLSHYITWYIVLDGFCPWFRGGKVDPPPSGAPWVTFLTAK